MRNFIKRLFCFHEWKDVDDFSKDYPLFLSKMIGYHPYKPYKCIHCKKIKVVHRNIVMLKPFNYFD